MKLSIEAIIFGIIKRESAKKIHFDTITNMFFFMHSKPNVIFILKFPHEPLVLTFTISKILEFGICY